MKVNGYSLKVSPGHESLDGYVSMKDETFYKLIISNTERIGKCKAEVKIDGEDIGVFVINGLSNLVLESKPGTGKLFKFRKLTDKTRNSLLKPNENLGLISVTFYPEDCQDDRLKSNNNEKSLRGRAGGQSAGGTVLSGYSNQKFKEAKYFNVDESKKVTIYLRLICKDEEEDISLFSSNPIPPSLI